MKKLFVLCPWTEEDDAKLILQKCRSKCEQVQVVWTDITQGITEDMLGSDFIPALL